jgi:hypothetical protein
MLTLALIMMVYGFTITSCLTTWEA